MIILGIDPGSVRVGYGAIKKEGDKLIHLQSGLLDIPQDSKENQLVALEKSLQNLITKIKPNLIGVEKLYFAKNKKTALEVAQARGVIINVIAKSSISFIEVSPSQVKQGVTGNGRASKKAVAKMVNYFLNSKYLPAEFATGKVIDDITDALAIAITISNNKEFILS